VSRGNGRRTGGQADHAVQFCLADGELAGSVSRYLAEDVRSGDGVVADTRSFPADLDSVRAARHYATGLLEPADQPLASDLAIAVTELAANAVLHARSAFTVTVSRWATGIRVAVRDNAAVPATGEPVPFPVTTGHGLSVVAALASRWGVERTPAGKVVWAELGAC
jgi:anti-sigma regulatory factor (Ser/Thr protein kinase)